MTQVIQSLSEIVDQFDAIVLDQWGVLHDGSAPYPLAVNALKELNALGIPLAVLSNSGKRAQPNAERIAQIGFGDIAFTSVMTSGEALWQDIEAGRVAYRALYPITRADGDAQSWANGLEVQLVDAVDHADAILLMGLPDGANAAGFDRILADAKQRDLPVLCTNPDRASPRADGVTVVSPGALAHAFAENDGDVRFYGKPHGPVFDAVAQTLATKRLLMVGDSLEHDIAGGHAAGWSTAFIQGGLHAKAFTNGDQIDVLTRLAGAENAPLPTFTLSALR